MTLVERCDEIVRLIDETLSVCGGEPPGSPSERPETDTDEVRSWHTIIP